MSFDYRRMLKAYMHNVFSREGVDYFGGGHLSDEEWTEMERLAAEVEAEWDEIAVRKLR